MASKKKRLLRLLPAFQKITMDADGWYLVFKCGDQLTVDVAEKLALDLYESKNAMKAVSDWLRQWPKPDVRLPPDHELFDAVERIKSAGLCAVPCPLDEVPHFVQEMLEHIVELRRQLAVRGRGRTQKAADWARMVIEMKDVRGMKWKEILAELRSSGWQRSLNVDAIRKIYAREKERRRDLSAGLRKRKDRT